MPKKAPRRLPRSFSIESIQAVWHSSRDARGLTAGSPGIDRATAAQFSSDLKNSIRDIRRELQQGRYRFRTLRAAPVPKANGGERIIAIPTVRDRLIQRVALAHLEKDKRFSARSEISFGFSKNRTLQDAQRRALELRQQHPWVLQADIVKFFDNISRHQIKKKIHDTISSKTVCRLLVSAVDTEIDYADPKIKAIAYENGIRPGRGLRQGMPVSPLLSNLLLKEFDESLVQAGIVAVRYADDVSIFADSEKACLQSLDLIKEKLSELRLKIPELAEGSKTTIASPEKPVEFLGVDIKRFNDGYRLCAPFKKIGKIDAKLKAFCNVEYCISNKRTLVQTLRSIDSLLVGHDRSMAIVSDRDEFAKRLASLRKTHVKALLISILGENAVKQLSAQKQAVLGVAEF